MNIASQNIRQQTINIAEFAVTRFLSLVGAKFFYVGLIAALPILALLTVQIPDAVSADLTRGELAVVVHSTARGVAVDLPAALLKPAGDGPFAAVVVMHDCTGLGAGSSGIERRWANFLVEQGYVVLLADSFTPRGFANGVCTVSAPQQAAAHVDFYARGDDSYAALNYLRGLAYIVGDRIGIMGSSLGGNATLAAMIEDPAASYKQKGFAAAVTLYPGCGAPYGAWSVRRENGSIGAVSAFVGTYKPVAPLLILIGASDDWTPAEHCRVLAERAQAAGYPVTLKIYEGAHHLFDSNVPINYNGNRTNPNKPDGRGATIGGSADAWADSIEQVRMFFGQYLM